MVNCPACRQRRHVRSIHSLCCAECGTPALEILEGRELIEVFKVSAKTGEGMKACLDFLEGWRIRSRAAAGISK
jgi:hypothetical protein